MDTDVLKNKAPIPQGKYKPAIRHHDIVYTSGMTPRQNGKLIFTGKVSSSMPLATYKEAVQLAATNAVNAVKSTLLDSERIGQILSMTVFIAAESDFEAHTKLADYASDYLHDTLGEIGIGSRTAIGVATLPGSANIEIQMIAMIETSFS